VKKYFVRNKIDSRKYEKTLSETVAQVYRKGTHRSGWALIHKWFISRIWVRKFRGLLLDFGCGAGLVTGNLLIEGRKVVSTDVPKNMWLITKKEYACAHLADKGIAKHLIYSLISPSKGTHVEIIAERP